MSEHKKSLPSRQQAAGYTLFLDRDGVVNKPIIDDYARRPDDFQFSDGALAAIKELNRIFKYVILVTNQQGVQRGLMSEKDLEDVHLKMYNGIKQEGASYYTGTFFAPYLKSLDHSWRKPSNGMLLKAKTYFSDIDWEKSIMVGDSPGDMKLADTLDLIKVKIRNKQFSFQNQDHEFSSLAEFVECLS